MIDLIALILPFALVLIGAVLVGLLCFVLLCIGGANAFADGWHFYRDKKKSKGKEK